MHAGRIWSDRANADRLLDGRQRLPGATRDKPEGPRPARQCSPRSQAHSDQVGVDQWPSLNTGRTCADSRRPTSRPATSWAAIDYGQPLPRAPYGGQVGAGAGPAYNPIANWLAAQSMQPGIWQNLAAFAQPMDRMERGARGVVGMAGEATGFPAAGRAGEQLAAGNIPQAVGEGLQALPSRMGSVLGFPLASAEAQPVDPRQKRIDQLTREVAGHRTKLEEMAKINYRSTKARSDASAPYLSAIDKAQAEATKLQDALNAEFQAANDAAAGCRAWGGVAQHADQPGLSRGRLRQHWRWDLVRRLTCRSAALAGLPWPTTAPCRTWTPAGVRLSTGRTTRACRWHSVVRQRRRR